VRKLHASVLAACARRKARHDDLRSVWRRLEPGLEQHLAHGGRRHGDAEAFELADDPLVSPVRVLPGESQDQLAERALERRSPRHPVRVCPPAGDELAVPAKQRLRLEREGRPGRPRKRAAQRRQQRPIRLRQTRPRGPSAEGRQLMAEDEGSPTPLSDAAAPEARPAQTGSAQRDTRHVFAAGTPDLDAYLEDQHEGMI
jgi:hypothetical protein